VREQHRAAVHRKRSAEPKHALRQHKTHERHAN
jgi:hypothetical protein